MAMLRPKSQPQAWRCPRCSAWAAALAFEWPLRWAASCGSASMCRPPVGVVAADRRPSQAASPHVHGMGRCHGAWLLGVDTGVEPAVTGLGVPGVRALSGEAVVTTPRWLRLMAAEAKRTGSTAVLRTSASTGTDFAEQGEPSSLTCRLRSGTATGSAVEVRQAAWRGF